MLSTLCSHYRSYRVWSRLGHVSRAHSPGINHSFNSIRDTSLSIAGVKDVILDL